MQHRPPLIPYDSFAFAAEPPEFPARYSGDYGSTEYVTRAEIRSESERGVVLSGATASGEPVTITLSVVAPGVVRVLLECERDPDRVTLARYAPDRAVEASVEKSGGSVTLVSDDIAVHVNLDPFHIAFHGPGGRRILDQNYTETNVQDNPTTLPFGYSKLDGQRVAFHDTFTAEPDEHFYGFGEKFTGFDKRGQRLEMWHYDAYGAHTERAYKNIPFFVSTQGYGIFVDSITRVNFDMAASNNSTFNIVVPDTALDYYVVAGPDPKTIISRYAGLVGLPTLPPKWAFGLWMSSGFQRDSSEAVLERARAIRDHDIPCDVLHLDCYWQRHGRWSEMLWDKEMFPDPESMIREVKEMGFKVCLWINPYLGIESERFDEAAEKGHLLKTTKREPYVAELWSAFHPPVGIVDFTNPEAVEWFKDLLRPLLRQGVDVFKTDFGEGVPADAVAYNGMSGEKLHNLYPLLYNDAVAEVTREETGRTPLVWGRSTYAGGQRHAAQWSGDPNCTYTAMASTLRGGLSMAVCGHGFWSHDIGGFHRKPTPDLYTRWAQFGLLSPLSRAHGMTTRLPWDYGEEASRIFRDYDRLRYRLLPYIYTYASIAAETGLPLMRPMVLEFPEDPCTHTMDLQYMLGSELLVAPIYNEQGERYVYFPGGQWVDFWTHEVISGPQTRLIRAPLDIMPIYVKANTLLPTIEPPEHLTEEPFERVTFEAYLLDEGSFELHDTDGATRITTAFDGPDLNVEVTEAKQEVGIKLIPLPGAPAVRIVRVNGHTLPQVNPQQLTYGSGWSRGQDGVVRLVYKPESTSQ